MEKKFFRVELAVIVMGVFLLTLYFSDGGVTGFALVQSFDVPFDVVVSNSEVFELRGAMPFSVSSFFVAGEVVGDGAVVVELVGRDGKKVVFSNLDVDQEKIGLMSVGGDVAPLFVVPKGAVDVVPVRKDGRRGKEGVFEECGEACRLSPAWSQDSYELRVLVEPGTRVLLKRVRFSS